MLGHARLGTTQIYSEVSIEQLKEVHARTHPSNKAGKQRKNDDNTDRNASDGATGEQQA